MPECSRCGAFVTASFIRVFGDNDGEVHGCHACLSFKELTAGRASRAPEEPR